MDCAKVPGLADAHVNGDESGSFAEVTRNQWFSGGWTQIKISEPGAHDVCRGAVAIYPRRSKGGTLGEEPVAISVLPGNDIEWSSRTGNDKWVQAHLPPWQIDRACECKTM